MNPIARRLSSLPSGLHFRELNLAWTHKDENGVDGDVLFYPRISQD